MAAICSHSKSNLDTDNSLLIVRYSQYYSRIVLNEAYSLH